MDADVLGPFLLLSPLLAAFGLVIPVGIERVLGGTQGPDYADPDKRAFLDAVAQRAPQFRGYALHAGALPRGGVYVRLTTKQGQRLGHLAAEGLLTPTGWRFQGRPKLVAAYRVDELRRLGRRELDTGQVFRVSRHGEGVELSCPPRPLDSDLAISLLVASMTGAGLARPIDGAGAGAQSGTPVGLPF